MTEANRRENIRLELERAGRDLQSAPILRDAGLLEGVITHSYYAAFHYGRALLLMDGTEARTHRGVIHLLHRDFGRTGRLAPELIGLLSELQTHRESADYDAAAVFTEAMANDALSRTSQFVEAAIKLLKAEGYL